MITWDEGGSFRLNDLAAPAGEHPLAVDRAVRLLKEEWDELAPSVREGSLPVLCAHGVNPLFEGARALLLPGLPHRIEQQIAAMHLQNPIDVRTHVRVGGIGVISRTLIDLTPERVIVVGDARSVCHTLGTLGQRLSFSNDRHVAVRQIRDTLATQTIEPLGSSLLLGGLGAIFAFEARFLVLGMQGLDAGRFGGLLMSAGLSLLGVLAFLVQEAFESRMVAFTPWWAIRPKLVSWLIFLAALLASPLLFFVQVDARLLCEVVRWAGFCLMSACALTTCGEIMFGAGLSKGWAIAWWLAMMCLVASAPLLIP